MRYAIPIFLLALGSLSAAGDRKRNQPLKPAEIEIVEVAARRGEGRISLDGQVKNAGERPATGVVLIFDFMAPGKQVITTKRGPLDTETLEPGEVAEFHAYVPTPPRAVEVRIQAEERNGRELKVVKPGPYVID